MIRYSEHQGILNMTDILCKYCNTLLMRAENVTGIITCPKCNKTNWAHHCEMCEKKRWHEVIYDDFVGSIIDYSKMYAVGMIIPKLSELNMETLKTYKK